MKKSIKTVVAVTLAAMMIIASVTVLLPQTIAAEEQTAPAEWVTQIDSMLDGREYVEGEVIVVFDNGKTNTDALVFSTMSEEGDIEILAEVSGEAVEETFDTDEKVSDLGAGIQLISDYTKSTKEILEGLADNPAVLWAEPNYITYTEDFEEESEALVNEAEPEETDPVSEQVETEEAETEPVSELTDTDSVTIDSEVETSAESEVVNIENTEEIITESTDITKIIYTANASDIITNQGYDKVGDQSCYQWGYTEADTGLYSISSPNWNKTGEKNVTGTPVVAVMDSGIDYTHPEFEGILVDTRPYGGGQYGYNCSGDGAEDDPMDDNGHGTHCAGIIAAKWDGIGTSGVASGVKLCIIRASEGGAFTVDNIVRAFLFLSEAVDDGMNLYSINCSFGGEATSSAETLMQNELGKKGVITCVASGNSSKDNDDHPNTSSDFGTSPYSIAVNASAANYIASDYTNYGQSTTDLFSPGDAILAPVCSMAQTYDAAFDENRKYYDSFSTSTPAEDQVKITYVGEIDTKKNEYLDFNTFAELKTFIDGSTPVGNRITTTDSFDNDGYAYEVEVGGMTKADNRQVYLAAVPVDTGEVGNISHFSFALKSTLDNAQTWVRVIRFQTVDEGNESTLLSVGATDGWKRPSKTWVNMSRSISKNVEGSMDAGFPCYNGYIYFAIIVYDGKLTGETSKLYIDSVGAGNSTLRYDFFQGTSMATPAITGATAIMYDELVNDGTLDGMSPAEKAKYVANAMKASVIQNDNYKTLCASNGGFSFAVDKADYVPVINQTSQEGNVLTLSGQYFGSAKGSITLAGVNCTISSWKDTEIKAVIPDSVEGGRNLLNLTASNGKIASRKVVTTGITGKTLFEGQVELPEGLKGCKISAMTGVDGVLYVVPEKITGNYVKPIENKELWSYNPTTDEWKQLESIPVCAAYDTSSNGDEVRLTTYKGLVVALADYTKKAATPVSPGTTSLLNEEERETLLFFYNPKTETWTKIDTSGLGLPVAGTIFATDDGLFYCGGHYLEMRKTKIDDKEITHKKQVKTKKIYKLNFNEDDIQASKETVKVNSVTDVGESGKYYDYYFRPNVVSSYGNDVLLQLQTMEILTWSEKDQKFTTTDAFTLPEKLLAVGYPGEPVAFAAAFASVLTADGLLITALNGDNYTKRGFDTFYFEGEEKVTSYGKYAYFADLYDPIACVSNGYCYVWGNTYYDGETLGYLTYTKVRNPQPEPEPTTTEPEPTTTEPESTTKPETTATTTAQETTTAKKNVDTGDRANTIPYVIMIIFAAALATTAIGIRKYKNNR